MRIQHNIAALNSYRNLTTNNSAVSKNLEKLSSGYRINRAGDDAAGLAISEKMRAQITGLKTAQKNANDGISLVQTAEGAMTEIHSMLNRMIELADQSANGTYADEVDRENLQKEVASLKDEIDRIADSTNFNGINLLDGSLDSVVSETVKDPTIIGQKAFAHYNNFMTGTVDDPQLHTETAGASKTAFTVGFNDYTLKAADDGNGNYTAKFQLGLGLSKTDGTMAAAFATEELTLEGNEGQEFGAKEIADKVYDSIQSDAATGKKLVKLNFSRDMLPDWGTDKLATPDEDNDIQVEYEVTKNDDGTLRFTMTDKGQQAAADYVSDAANTAPITDTFRSSAFEGNFTICLYDGNGGATGTRELGVTDVQVGGISNGTKLAQTVIDMDEYFASGTVKDGSGIKIGDVNYVFAATEKTATAKYGDNTKIVDIRDLVGDDGKTLKTADKIGGTTAARQMLSRLTEAAKDNEMFSVEYGQDAEAIGFTEREGYNGNGKDGRANLTTKEGLMQQIQFFSGIEANVTTSAAKGKDLNLQIGDTSDEFNKLSVSVRDMHAGSMGIGDVDVSTQASAAEAVDKIKSAINYVSSTRGDLGAIQNRLEHTINNLSVATENITAAESRIRDVDMAEEMMAYTKNNILVQASQAMLAQANQIPQGVLQLLQ